MHAIEVAEVLQVFLALNLPAVPILVGGSYAMLSCNWLKNLVNK